MITCTGSLKKRVLAGSKLLATLRRRPNAAVVTDTPEWIGLMAWMAATLMRRPYILRLRGDAVREFIQRGERIHLNFFEKIFLPQAAGTIVVSNYLAKELKQKLPNLSTDKIKIIPTPQTVVNRSKSFQERRPWLLVVMSFRLARKVEKLIEIVSSFDHLLSEDRNVSIHILGDGPLLKHFARQIKQIRHSDRIVLHGHVEEISSAYLEARALLHVSNLDAYPSVVNEARAHGLPVIVSNNVGMQEQVEEGVDGFFLEESPKSLKRVWRKISDVDCWSRLSREGRRRVVRENSPGVIGIRFKEVIAEMLNNSLRNGRRS
jgi:glycosyltransferase involved in cell wall biosynthesis